MQRSSSAEPTGRTVRGLWKLGLVAQLEYTGDYIITSKGLRELGAKERLKCAAR